MDLNLPVIAPEQVSHPVPHACHTLATPPLAKVEPKAVMSFLNALFTKFDAMCDEHGVQKVETAGQYTGVWTWVWKK